MIDVHFQCSREESLIFVPRNPARVLSELARWFGGRVPASGVIDVGTSPSSRSERRSSGGITRPSSGDRERRSSGGSSRPSSGSKRKKQVKSFESVLILIHVTITILTEMY